MNTPLDKAIDLLGGPARLARRFHISAQAVCKWDVAPVDRCPAIEHATGGVVPVEELRPDVRWVRVNDAAWPHPAGRPLIDLFEKVSAADTAAEKAAA